MWDKELDEQFLQNNPQPKEASFQQAINESEHFDKQEQLKVFKRFATEKFSSDKVDLAQ